MAEIQLQAITAIKDMEQEGSIAASLIRLGWKVMYRATSPELLIQNLDKHPEAVVLLSDDFLDPRKVPQRRVALLRGRSEAISLVGEGPPQSDFELCEILRGLSREQEAAQIVIPATQSHVAAFTSSQGGVGTTTLAMNVADQISAVGKNVLLVDAYPGRASIASHFELHDIRSSAKELHEHLSIFEISEQSQLIHLAKIARDFDHIILDLGVLTEKSISGARVMDQTFQWILHSQGTFIISSSDNLKSIDRNLKLAKLLRSISAIINVELLINLDTPLSRRARVKVECENSERYSIQVSTLSRDIKSMKTAEEHATTLRLSAPRSQALREISRFTNERVLKK